MEDVFRICWGLVNIGSVYILVSSNMKPLLGSVNIWNRQHVILTADGCRYQVYDIQYTKAIPLPCLMSHLQKYNLFRVLFYKSITQCYQIWWNCWVKLTTTSRVIIPYPRPLSTKRTDVLPQDLAREVSKPRDSGLHPSNRYEIWVMLPKCLSSNTVVITSNLAASRLPEIWR